MALPNTPNLNGEKIGRCRQGILFGLVALKAKGGFPACIHNHRRGQCTKGRPSRLYSCHLTWLWKGWLGGRPTHSSNVSDSSAGLAYAVGSAGSASVPLPAWLNSFVAGARPDACDTAITPGWHAEPVDILATLPKLEKSWLNWSRKTICWNITWSRKLLDAWVTSRTENYVWICTRGKTDVVLTSAHWNLIAALFTLCCP